MNLLTFVLGGKKSTSSLGKKKTASRLSPGNSALTLIFLKKKY